MTEFRKREGNNEDILGHFGNSLPKSLLQNHKKQNTQTQKQTITQNTNKTKTHKTKHHKQSTHNNKHDLKHTKQKAKINSKRKNNNTQATHIMILNHKTNKQSNT